MIDRYVYTAWDAERGGLAAQADGDRDLHGSARSEIQEV